MLRHKAFKNVGGFKAFLKKIVPSHVYYSSAYYENPEAEMRRKGWLGADLFFDIDADHIPTPCKKLHDRWTCTSCGAVGKGAPPDKCPGCGRQKFDEKTWPCEVCLEAAKAETMKLLDMLMEDFGFSAGDITVCFSGHRGYHVQVESGEVQALDGMARKEIVDYVVGVGLETIFHGLEKKEARVLAGPGLEDKGWRGRIARGTYDFLLNASLQELKQIGLGKKAVDVLTKNKDKLLGSWRKVGPWSMIRNVGVKSWEKIAAHAVDGQSAKIDTVVTPDVHRLIRLTGSLHGKTGLRKVEVPLESLESFDPFKSAIAFKEGKVRVFVSEAPEFRIEDETYGPYKEQRVELPTAAALLLLCKGLAEVAE
ncbi:MAG: DNA primase small subunit domain-containing protein [Thermoproteota archaeon]|nr:DNA primase small subunit domain-containing protein [Thermoproteota archaeon]